MRAAVALCMCLIAGRARAQEPSDGEVAARLAFIDHSLSRGAIGASLWWGGWMGYAAAEASYGWVRYARASDRLERDLWLVTGIGSSLWVAQLLIFPLEGAYAPRRMHRLPRATPAQRKEALVQAERLLERSARSAREQLHWSEHVLDMSWALGSAAYVYWHNHGHVAQARLRRETLLDLGLTVLLSEAAILSTPRRAIRDERAYRGLQLQLMVSGARCSYHF